MTAYQTIDDLMGKGKQKKSSKKTPARDAVQDAFSKKMHDVGLKEREIETKRFAQTVRYPHISLEKFPISQHALKVIPQATVEETGAVCFFVNNDEFRVGAIDPTTDAVQSLFADLEKNMRAHGALYVISEHSFKRALRMYERLPIIAPVTKDIEIRAEDLEKVQADINDFRSLQGVLADANITDMVTVVLGAGLKLDASDIHIEAEETGIHVRLRLDGILQDVAQLPKEQYARFVSRIKLVSSLKINIADKPQDGRFSIKLSSGDIDVRVSTIPTVYGESIVMRLLRQDREQITLEKLGLRGRAFDVVQREILRPNGMIVTTGPTGSGKTTTLYAMMHLLNKPGVKILTLEDPVEYKMEGINQSQVDPSKEYTFAKGLRSMLRQDPDIAMVGEIRDLETAEIAVQAALTGHLILTTTHTNSASGTIPRFLSMGVKPFLLAPALNCVMAQRLVRRLCDGCKVAVDALEPARAEEVQKVLEALPSEEKEKMGAKAPVFYDAKGCEQCNGIGYKGRLGIFEVFVVEKHIEKLILSGKMSEYDIQEAIVSAGMVTMVQDGMLKAIDGLTSVSEVFRVIE